MGVLNPLVLGLGGLLIAVPVVLHLIMRPRPQHLIFPALRFVQQRRDANRRRMQWQHWLLLALRCALIGMLALALARPRWSLSLGAGNEEPVAAVLVFDTSPRMAYRQENQPRLQAAQELAEWLLRQLPDDSEIAVVDSRATANAFARDRSTVRRTLEGLTTTNTPVSLTSVMRSALKLVSSSSLPRKEIYVFTDHTAAAWETSATQSLSDAIDNAGEPALYVIDVGIPEPRNYGLGQLQLAPSFVAPHGTLTVRAPIHATGPGAETIVQISLEQPDPQRPIIVDGKPLLPELQVRGRQTVALAENAMQQLEFTLPGLPPGIHHGQVRVLADDGLPCDDVRFFTVAVRDPWPVLVAHGAGASERSLTELLSPYALRELGQVRFRCDAVAESQLAESDLQPYPLIGLLDPGPLTPAVWQKLATRVRAGAGLAIFLGRNAVRESFNETSAQQVLPGQLQRLWRGADTGTVLAPDRIEHPILAPFRGLQTRVPWQNFSVFQHWQLDALSPDATVVLAYANGRPAMIERPLGNGRVLLMTTPISDGRDDLTREPWNEIYTGEDPWPVLILLDQTMLYLTRNASARVNYLAGQAAAISLGTAPGTLRCQLFTPLGQWQDLSADGGDLNYQFTEALGVYRLRSLQGNSSLGGFSVNLPTEASNLERATPEQLAALLGADRYQVARKQDEIQRRVGLARRGYELYPYAMMLLALLMGLEHWVANRFYRATTGASPQSGWSSRAAAQSSTSSAPSS